MTWKASVIIAVGIAAGLCLWAVLQKLLPLAGCNI